MAAQLIFLILQLFSMLILARVLMSWVQIDPYHPVAQFIHNTTEPFLRPIRDVLPPAGGMDFSPMVLMIIVIIIGQVLAQTLS